VGAIGAVLITYWAALAFVSRRAALLAGLMMASCLVLGLERLLAKTDAMLLMTVVAAMGAMARAYLPARDGSRNTPAAWPLAAVFWTALAAGVLLKGPLILMVVGLAAVALAVADRSAQWLLRLKPLAGTAWFALLVVPWFAAILGRAGGEFVAGSAGQDLLGKLIGAQETHGAPPGYYLALFWVTFFPGAMLAQLSAPSVWSTRAQPAIRFLLAWLVPSWLVLELVITKLPHYVLPLYPAIAILTAGAIDARTLSRKRWLVWGTVWWFVIPLVLGVASILILVAVGLQLGLAAWPLIAGAAIMGLLAWRLYETDGAEQALLRAVASAVLTSIAIFGVVVPALAYAFPSPALARILRESGCAHPIAAAVGYQEPSLIFLAGTDTRLTDGMGAAEFLRGGACRFAFVDSRHEKSFAQRAQAIGLHYSAVTRIEAFNISHGERIAISVYRSSGGS
jgi:4-amino-4-deoxy-L-arabinose transferase-like glycosyltransferase